MTQYLETRHHKQTLTSIRNYISDRSTDGSVMFAICINDRHIGNVKLGAMQKQHKYLPLSYFIGDRTQWNQGFATQAVKQAVDYAFLHMGAHRVEAGTYAVNKASERVLLKAGFHAEGTQKSRFRCNDEWVDHLLFVIINGAD